MPMSLLLLMLMMLRKSSLLLHLMLHLPLLRLGTKGRRTPTGRQQRRIS
jgi:hypothetical protein